MRKIYLASSWRNLNQPLVLEILREAGHEVYDFRHPAEGNNGFHWSEIDRRWQAWSPAQFLAALTHPVAKNGFQYDWQAMQWADTGVLLLPCGRSAHLEAGYFVGAGKPLYILLSDGEPELMYKMATGICLTISELVNRLKAPWE